MSKDIKDYLHLYLGCDVVVHNDDPKKRLVRTFFGFADPTKTSVYIYDRLAREGRTIVTFIKLILRPLSNMTEEEVKELKQMDHLTWSTLNILPEIRASHLINFYFSQSNAEWTRWLLSKHFDLFGLIESGLAIDKTKL